MRKIYFILCMAMLAVSCTDKRQPIDYVDPFIGTDETHKFSMWRMEAATYPGAVAPHGMAQLSPETSAAGDFLNGYYYSQDTIRRISLVDHLSGWPNGSSGKICIMPGTITVPSKEIERQDLESSFSHKNETAKPGYYQVYLQDSKINCSFSALPKSAFGTFNYEKEGKNIIHLSNYGSLNIISDNEIEITAKAGNFGMGNQYMIHVYLLFDKSFEVVEQKKANILEFDSDKVSFKYGVSYTSIGNAKDNLLAEIPHWDIEKVRSESEDLWKEQLSIIVVEGDIDSNKTIFYTARYHASLIPINATDYNRQFPGYEKNVALQQDETHYIYFTPWDAFRSTYPLTNFLNPKKGLDYIQSMLRFYNAYGILPEPTVMTSVFVSSMIADALAKGIDDFDVELAYKALKEMMVEEPLFRTDVNIYDSLGYVPFPKQYATTATMEFAFNDWSLSKVAEYIGDTSMAERMKKRSFNYRNNYHPQERYFLTKNTDGAWADASIYAEADKYNMSWMVPHNVQDLINLMGGDTAFVHHLESIFIQDHFVLDNECPLIFPFLFSHAGMPWKTMKWKNSVAREFFNASPGGIPGNDDWGTLSSWYVWSAIGLFPVTPGTDELIISGPIFKKVTITRSEKDVITILSNNANGSKDYVQSMKFEGELYSKPFISQNSILPGSVLTFEMSEEPNEVWGISAKPYSQTKITSNIKVLECELEKNVLETGDTIKARLWLKNDGAKGSIDLQAKKGNDILLHTWALLETGEQNEIVLKFPIYKPGEHILIIGGIEKQVKILPIELPYEECFNFSEIKAESFVKKGSSLIAEVFIQNTSSESLDYSPKIIINGKEVDELQKITLGSGEKQKLDVSINTENLTGVIQKMQIGNSPIKVFKVYENNTDALALHYTFDGDRDSVTDASGFDNHGVLVGGYNYVEGISGKGIRFSNGYVKVPHSNSLDIDEDEISILVWYKPGKEDGRASLVTKGMHNMLKLNGSWQAKLAIGGWGRGQAFYNVKPKNDKPEPQWLGQWTHFVGTGDLSSINLFVDGQKVKSEPHKGKILSSDFEWRIGGNAEYYSDPTPNGVIDEVMIFARELTDKEILEIFNRNIK